MTKGKVVLVPFPFDDLSASKVRPAVCLTDPIGSHRHVVVAFISSQLPADSIATDVVLDVRRSDFGATGLRVASVLRLHRLVTLSTGRTRMAGRPSRLGLRSVRQVSAPALPAD